MIEQKVQYNSERELWAVAVRNYCFEWLMTSGKPQSIDDAKNINAHGNNKNGKNTFNI